MNRLTFQPFRFRVDVALEPASGRTMRTLTYWPWVTFQDFQKCVELTNGIIWSVINVIGSFITPHRVEGFPH